MFKINNNVVAGVKTFKSVINNIKSEYNNQLDIIHQAEAEAQSKSEAETFLSKIKPQVVLNDVDGLTNLFKNTEYNYVEPTRWGRFDRDLNYLSKNTEYNFATIIDDLTILVNTYKDDIEEYMYSFDAYHEDYNECIINFCNTLGVNVVPQHHEIKYTICERRHFSDPYNNKCWDDIIPVYNIMDFIVNFICGLISHSDSLYNDELFEGGYMFEEDFDALNLNFKYLGIEGDDDVDLITFKQLVYYAGCIYAENGIC
jgi:hypothetical protein